MAPHLQSLTVTITNLQDGTNERLTVDTSGTNITTVYNFATGTLTLTGQDTVDNYEQVLGSLVYTNEADAPNVTDRIIEVVANDGQAHTNTSAVATIHWHIRQQPTG